jgi:hypothetical protein
MQLQRAATSVERDGTARHVRVFDRTMTAALQPDENLSGRLRTACRDMNFFAMRNESG